MPIYTQRLLVLLFGTFRVIAVNSELAQTYMNSEALGVSVAPSLFQSCVSDGKTAKMEDILRFKVNNILSSLIFAVVFVHYYHDKILFPFSFWCLSIIDNLFLDCYTRHQVHDRQLRRFEFIRKRQLRILRTYNRTNNKSGGRLDF